MAISLFFPGITAVVVSLGFPKPSSILFCELNTHNPLGAFPKVKPWNDKPHWVAMLRTQWLVIMFDGEQDIWFEEVAQREIGGEASSRVDRDELSLGKYVDKLPYYARTYSFPQIVKL